MEASRQQQQQATMSQIEFDIEKLLEMNAPPFPFIESKFTELQTLMDTVGTTQLNLKIELIRRVEALKDRYSAVKNGINERELIELQFAIQTAMTENRPKLEEIDQKLTQFRTMLSKIPLDSKLLTKWNTLACVLYQDYHQLKKRTTINRLDDAVKTLASVIERSSDVVTAAALVQQQSIDTTTLALTRDAQAKQSSDDCATSSTAATAQTVSQPLLIDIVSSFDDEPKSALPAPLPIQPQSADKGPAPVPTTDTQKKQSDEWNAPPAPAVQTQSKQSVNWSSPLATSFEKKQLDDWAATPASVQQQSKDTSSAPAFQIELSDKGGVLSAEIVHAKPQLNGLSAPSASVQKQSNNVDASAPSAPAFQKNHLSDDLNWGLLPSPADQTKQKSNESAPAVKTQQQHSDEWSTPPTSAFQNKMTLNDWAASPSVKQNQQSNNWSAASNINTNNLQPRMPFPQRPINAVRIGYRYNDRNQGYACRGNYSNNNRYPSPQRLGDLPRRLPRAVVQDFGCEWNKPFEPTTTTTTSTPQGQLDSKVEEEKEKNQCPASIEEEVVANNGSSSPPDESTTAPSELEQLVVDITRCLDAKPLVMESLVTMIPQLLALVAEKSTLDDEPQPWRDQVDVIMERFTALDDAQGKSKESSQGDEENSQTGPQVTDTVAAMAALLDDLAKWDAEVRHIVQLVKDGDLEMSPLTGTRLDTLLNQMSRHISQIPIDHFELRQQWEVKMGILRTEHLVDLIPLDNKARSEAKLDALVNQLADREFEVEQAIMGNSERQLLPEKLAAMGDLVNSIPHEYDALRKKWQGILDQLTEQCDQMAQQLLNNLTSNSDGASTVASALPDDQAHIILKIAFDRLLIIRAARDLERLKPLLSLTAKAHQAATAKLHNDILLLALQRMSVTLVEQFKAQAESHSLPQLLSFLGTLIRQQSDPADEQANFCLKCTTFGHTDEACTQTAPGRINLATLLNF